MERVILRKTRALSNASAKLVFNTEDENFVISRVVILKLLVNFPSMHQWPLKVLTGD